MPVKDNKQPARRFYEEVINARNVDALTEPHHSEQKMFPSSVRFELAGPIESGGRRALGGGAW
jgi:hypothetical protein